jgi:hypothetical protein
MVASVVQTMALVRMIQMGVEKMRVVAAVLIGVVSRLIKF